MNRHPDSSRARSTAAGRVGSLLVWLALLSAPSVHAQLKSTDIGGFQLGQTVEQVEETLRTKYPKFQTAKIVFPGPDGKASSKVALMMAGIKDPTDSSITGNGRHPDAFSLAFSRVDGKPR